MKNKIIISILTIVLLYSLNIIIKKVNWNYKREVGGIVDTFNGINVYYNGGVGNSEGRNLTADGYNLGMKYQCVEFIKRYYYEYLKHRMPDSYGNAIDFYDKKLKDGSNNTKRNLVQYSNPSHTKPRENDIIIFDKSLFNSYGHVAIISKVEKDHIEIIQQNPGPFASSRERFLLNYENHLWLIDNKRILGRLAKPEIKLN